MIPGIPGVASAAMDIQKQRAEADQLQSAKDLNDAKKATYDKATIQARN